MEHVIISDLTLDSYIFLFVSLLNAKLFKTRFAYEVMPLFPFCGSKLSWNNIITLLKTYRSNHIRLIISFVKNNQLNKPHSIRMIAICPESSLMNPSEGQVLSSSPRPMCNRQKQRSRSIARLDNQFALPVASDDFLNFPGDIQNRPDDKRQRWFN